MKVSSLFVAFVLSIVLTGCFKGEGQVRIDSDVQNAIIYIDGDKKGMTGDGYTTIILDEGDHEVRIYKEIDKEWCYEGSQKIFVGANSSVKVKIDTDKKPTEFRLERLAKKQAWVAKHQKEGIFADYEQKLFWQDDAAAASVKKTWITQANYDAKNYMDTSGDTATTHCKNLTLAGYSDWRLPTKTELEGLYVSKKDLKHVSSNFYWSSTTNEYYNSKAWFVVFNYDYVDYYSKSNNYYVRCVRAGQ